MTPRHILLQQPHMTHLRDHPALEAMPQDQLEALEAFMGFCAEHAIGDPRTPDLHGFAQLQGQDATALLALSEALARLGLDSETLGGVRRTSELVRHRTEFRGITKGRNRGYTRRVSLPISDLPENWQATLLRLRREGRVATLGRMESRLCMFAWSARKSGLPLDLGNAASLKALYTDMRARSAAKSDGTPRWAYLRGTWEELRRFARHHGLPSAVLDGLDNTYSVLAEQEARQDALKVAKARHAGTISGLLRHAGEMLAAAEREPLPQRRHAQRNRAAAIALGCAVPARPEDVATHHVFGAGISFEPGRGAYRFRYVPQKRRGRKKSDPLDIPLLPQWNRFIDALILQDQDPKYLGALREQAFAAQRPLYVNYDGTPCAFAWYSRSWRKVTGTGGHIARTLVYDAFADAGEAGIQYGRIVNDHVSEAIPAKYRSERAVQQRYTCAQGFMVAHGKDDEDISDLL